MRIARLLGCLFLAVGMLAIPVPSRAQVAVGISVRIGPPVLPIYAQPLCPGPGFIWIPGYWAYDADDGYFWVPGTWVEPPEFGLLWTPGYWGWGDDFYIWHAGYWGPVVGFYGGIDYGYGYPGVGFYGGEWRGRTFFYNRSVTNVNVEVVRNTYNTTVINENRTVNRVSFNGGPGGTNARPTSAEMAAEHQRHVSMTSEQAQHWQAAKSDRSMRASVNHGRPDVAATPRPAQFNRRDATAPNRPVNPNRPPENPRQTDRRVNPRDNNNRPSLDRPSLDRPPSAQPRNSAPVNPKLEQKQQREQERMRQQQDSERQKMERKQAQEQQRADQQRANTQRQQQMQQRHQQQTEQLQRRHDQQTQKLQERQQREVQRQNNKPEKPSKPGRPPGA